MERYMQTGITMPFNLIVRPMIANFQQRFLSMKSLLVPLLTRPLLLLWKMFFHYHPEITMDTKDYIMHHGYPVETHKAITQDEYILDLYRIPNGKDGNRSGNRNKMPVLLQHGLLGSSAHWVFNLPQNSLAFLLADAGFDVFLGNFRGASRNHKSLNPNMTQFWKFSWDEMIRYDMPAMIDEVLKITGRKQLYCIGHSMGASVILCMLDTKPEYNDKIKAMFALAAVGNLTKLSKPLKIVAYYLTPLIDKFLVKTLGIHEFYFLRLIPKIVLGQITNYYRKSIVYILFISIGSDWVRLNDARLPIFASHVVGTSYHVLLHIFQIILTNQLSHYDLGHQTNLQKYGQSTPPRYNLTNVRAPVYLFYGANDKGTSKENVEFLKRKLSNVMGMHQAGDVHWNHISYLTAVDAGKVFHQKLINMLIEADTIIGRGENVNPEPVARLDDF